ncbi:MAG: zf-HC2 domain-containing protein [Acidobacteria bacterium]|nr:zf-HC2 domain-containing protein [Acidobacteriota bacterium]
MSCEELGIQLDDLVDGTLAGEARERVEAHLLTCAACRATFADLRRIREGARALPRLDPPADGWAKLSAALDTEAAAGSKTASVARPARGGVFATWRPAWGILAAAAVLAIAVATTLVLYRTPSAPGDRASGPAPGNAATGDLVSTVEMELQLADQHYQKAIAGLEQVWSEGRARWIHRRPRCCRRTWGSSTRPCARAARP